MPLKPRNPVLLVLIGLPLATLAAGFATLAVIGRGGLDTVGDPVRRTAQIQQVDLAADAAARRQGLVGRVGLEGPLVWVDLEGAVEAKGLRLRLEHPLDAAKDAEIALQAHEGRWRAPAFDARVGWRVALSPADGTWRLVARWPRGARGVDLAPAVAAGEPSTGNAGHGPG